VSEGSASTSETGGTSPSEVCGEIVQPCTDASRTPSWFRWRHSLSTRVAVIYLAATIPVLVGLSAAIYLFTAFYVDERLEWELATQADFHAAYAASLVSDARTLAGLAPTIVGLFAPQADLTVRLFAASDGALLASSQDIGQQPSLIALRELRYRSPTVFVRPSRDLPNRRYTARPIVVGGERIGVVEVSRSTLAIDRFLARLRYIMLGAILGAALVSLLVSIALARRLSRPVRDMQRATQQIAAGDFDVRLGRYPPDELDRLADGINDMAERLKELEAARFRFISEISHDLRTPLTAIKGLLVNLVDDPEIGEHPSLDIAERETDRLIRLVNQLLDFSRWQCGRLELNCCPVDIAAIVLDAVALNKDRARHRNVRLDVDVSPNLPQVTADPDRLRRVILNLLDNAIKFTLAGGRVNLAVTERQREIQVCVTDTGRGMSDEEQERAFEAYYRGKGKGTGLGLVISRAIVEAHGGRIAVESEPNRGSHVWFTIPL